MTPEYLKSEFFRCNNVQYGEKLMECLADKERKAGCNLVAGLDSELLSRQQAPIQSIKGRTWSTI